MGKINVYLPEALEAEVKDAGLPVSSICQAALREALAKPADDCRHTVIIRGRCEICGETVDIRYTNKRKRTA